MEGGGSSSGVNKVSSKTTTTRRILNMKEEYALMDVLKELVATGAWKSDNGFRPGYLQNLEEKLQKKIPGTNLVAKNINSKMTIWKRHHGCLQVDVDPSGGGIDPLTKVIDVSDVAWAKAVVKEPTISGMRYKPWPFYYDWIEVFGLDRANGKASEDVADAVNEENDNDPQVHVGDNSIPNQGNGENGYPIGEDVHCDMDVESQAPSVETAKTTPQSNNKRPFASKGENHKELFDGLAVLFKESDDKLIDAVKTIVVEDKGDNKTHDLFSIVNNIPGLSLDQTFDVCENLKNNPDRLEMFLGIPELHRGAYVLRLLNGDFGPK